MPGTALASIVGVRTPVLRLALAMIALIGSATRLHAHHADALDAAQEMNRCLRLVNVATTRRETPAKVRTISTAVFARRRGKVLERHAVFQAPLATENDGATID
jgi:hypothetical protein